MKYVYMFSEGNKDERDLLGGKGANLAEMTNLGFPIPQGFIISTNACKSYYESGEKLSKDIEKEIFDNLKKLEKLTGKKFGDLENPLLLSIRSGAPVSMPGMMDSILNLGLNDKSVEGFALKTGNQWFAYDSYRRFIQMYSDVVMEVPKSYFEKIIDEIKAYRKIKYDTELSVDDLKYLIKKYKEIYQNHMHGKRFPQDVNEQLLGAVNAVFRSWNNPRAIVYRKMNEISDELGTAVNVQSMVFGNMGVNSGTGVAFTRNPATGEKGIFGEYLINAQGEDVVAGVRTPLPISKLEEDMPEVYKEFINLAKKLEDHYKDMQDMEFTIEEGKLYFLQTRNGKRTANAAINIACDLVDERKIGEKEALMRIDAKSLDQLLHSAFVQSEIKNHKLLGTALPASPGASAGRVVFNAEDAKYWHSKGVRVILVRLETTPEDIEGMIVSEGVLTVRGGMTSHAAVVARGMGTCCVSGCGDIKINEKGKYFSIKDEKIKEGDYISLDGTTGNIYKGDIPTKEATIEGNFKRVMDWANKYKKLGIRTNADNPRDAKKAIELGAEGIGLCRTEHMFFDEERIPKIRKMILCDNEKDRIAALKALIPYQKSDFKKMYKELKGYPMTVRYLDPPLHEFLPTEEKDIKVLAKDMNITVEKLKQKIDELHEFNPMMGHRGCRLDVTYPEIARMQTKALIEAAIEVNKEKGYQIEPEIMIPLVGDVKELKFVKEVVIDTAEEVKLAKKSKINYHIGTMIEVPRAAILADEIAKEAEFFSFGTNDLTQMTFGFSRDDAGKFLESYYENKIYEFDPFARLDQNGVGKLVEMAAELGKKSYNKLHLGICGEHGGDPASIEFFNKVGLDYVSCSPYRIPIAKIAAAQASIREKQGQK